MITKSKCYMGPGDNIDLAGSATDADGDEVTYRWRAEDGTFNPTDGTGPDVTWIAPSGAGTEGTYRVTLVATDGIDESTRGIDIEVGRSLLSFPVSVTLDQTDLPYIVQWNGPVRIDEGVTVTIEAGVTLVFNGTTGGLYVRGGTLVVNGTAQDRVLMTSNVCPDEDRTWSGVTLNGAGSSGDISGLSMIYTASGMIVEEGATMTAADLLVDGSEGDGLTVRDGGSADVTGGHFWENEDGGIFVDNGTLSIQDSEIRYNAFYGFKIYGTAGQHSVSVTGCTISSNYVYGFLLGLQARPVVNGCEIFLNPPSGNPVAVELSPGYSNTADIDMTGNYWGVDTAPEISAQINLNGADVTVDFSGFLTSPLLE